MRMSACPESTRRSDTVPPPVQLCGLLSVATTWLSNCARSTPLTPFSTAREYVRSGPCPIVADVPLSTRNVPSPRSL